MKNRKSIVMAVAILIAIVGLAIGYALSSTSLTITGTANAKTTNEFSVAFDGVNTPATTDLESGMGATPSATSGATTGSCTVNLKTVNATATCTFEFKNFSPTGIDATIDASKIGVYTDSACTSAYTNSSDSYFNVAVTPGWSNTKTLHPNDTETFDVVVTLKKANVADSDYQKTFYVKLDDITPVAAA